MQQPDGHSAPPGGAADYAGFVLDAFGAADYDLDLATGALRPSPRLNALYGYPADHELTLADCRARDHPDDRAPLPAFIPEALTPGERRFEREFRIVLPGGDVRWVLSRGEVLFDAGGRPTRARGAAIDITERKRAEEAARESQERLQIALDAANMGTFVWYSAEDHAEPDERMLALFGAPGGGSYSFSTALVTLVHPEDRARYADAVGRAIDPGGTGRLREDIRVLLPDGSARWLAITGQASFEGGVARMVGMATDITARKRAEDALRESEARQAFLLMLSDALRDLADPIAIQDTAIQILGHYLGVSRVHYGEVTDDDEHIVIERYYTDGVPATTGRFRMNDFGPSVVTALRAGRTIVMADVAASPELSEAERTANARVAVAAQVGVPLVKGGRFVSILAVHHATPRAWAPQEVALIEEVAERTWAAVERARAEAALRESEENFRAMFDVSSVGKAQADAETRRFLRVNAALCALTGYTEAELLTMTVDELNHPEDRGRDSRLYTELRDGTSAYQLEQRYLRKDGSVVWVHVTGNVIRDTTGKPRRTVAVIQDITEQKRAEAALRESEERFRLLVEGARDYAMFLLDPDNCITFWSVGAERVFGWAEAEARGQSGAIIFTPEDRARGEVEREVRTALAEGRAEDRRWHARKDGARRFVDGVLIRLDDDHGRLRGLVKIGRDVTEQRHAEEALQRAHDELEIRVAERTAELLRLSSARQELLARLVTAQEDERRRVARELHDSLGQYLTGLTIRLSALQGQAAALPAVAAGLADLRQLASRIDAELDRLTRELRPPALDDLGLVQALRDYVAEWTATSGIVADVLTHGLSAASLPATVETIVYRIVQEALTNVVKHAQADQAGVILEQHPAFLRVIVEDNGQGFDPEGVGRTPGSGRQLGLVGMAERAKLAGGMLTVESAPGAGTTVYLIIPLTEAARAGVEDMPEADPGALQ